MIGIIGDKEFALRVKEYAINHLENNLKLEMRLENTKVTSLTHGRAKFLGVELCKPKANERKIVYKRFMGRKIPSIIKEVRIKFYMPFKEMLQDLATEGFLKNFIPGGKLETNANTK